MCIDAICLFHYLTDVLFYSLESFVFW